jgi:hypothetical protein
MGDETNYKLVGCREYEKLRSWDQVQMINARKLKQACKTLLTLLILFILLLHLWYYLIWCPLAVSSSDVRRPKGHKECLRDLSSAQFYVKLKRDLHCHASSF